MTSRRACRSSPLNFSKVAFATFIVHVDFVKGYKGCSCQSVRIERPYDGCEIYTTKQKWLAGLACNFFQVCDHSAMKHLMSRRPLYLRIHSCILSMSHFWSSPYTTNVTAKVKVFVSHLRHRKELWVSRFQTWLEGKKYTIGSDDAIICDCMKCPVYAFLCPY